MSSAELLTDSEAVFRDRCQIAGLPEATITILIGKNIKTLARLAFSVGQPGETPTDTALTNLVQDGGNAVPVSTLSSVRRLVFEAQTLMVSQVKSLVEHKADEAKTELAPAERAERIKKQAARLSGVPLRGENECAYQSYDTVMKMCQENVVSYLPPNKFPSRREELKQEKPKKELDVVNPKVLLRDQEQTLQCLVNTPLNLHHALHRRAWI